jgi:hypothetical protein
VTQVKKVGVERGLAATLNRPRPDALACRRATFPDDLPDRVVHVLGDVDEPASVGRIQRLLAADGIDVATRAD